MNSVPFWLKSAPMSLPAVEYERVILPVDLNDCALLPCAHCESAELSELSLDMVKFSPMVSVMSSHPWYTFAVTASDSPSPKNWSDEVSISMR